MSLRNFNEIMFHPKLPIELFGEELKKAVDAKNKRYEDILMKGEPNPNDPEMSAKEFQAPKKTSSNTFKTKVNPSRSSFSALMDEFKRRMAIKKASEEKISNHSLKPNSIYDRASERSLSLCNESVVRSSIDLAKAEVIHKSNSTFMKPSNDELKEIIKSQVTIYFNQDLNEDNMIERAKQLTTAIRENLKKIYTKRYKFVVQVYMGEKSDDNLKLLSMCFWEPCKDFHAIHVEFNHKLYCVTHAFAVHYH